MSAWKANSGLFGRRMIGWLLIGFVGVGCVKQPSTAPVQEGGSSDLKLTGTINIEGSSTVFPISQAIGTEFEAIHPDVHLAIAGNGTTSGFKKLISREAEICDASRPITEKETGLCQEAGI